MSSESKKKRGESGASNAKAIPYRYIGGSHDHPVMMDKQARMARTVAGSDHRQFSTYITGIIGGIMWAKMGFPFPGWEQIAEDMGA